MSNENALIPYEQVEKMALTIAKSGLFGVKTPEQALALMLVAQAEGLHPVTAARDYHIIEGKPTLKSDAMLARFVQDGGKVTWIDYSDAKVSAKFQHPKSGEITVDWDIARATRAGLAGRNVWKSYPRNMMRARVISEGVRSIAPWVAVGVITKEEAEDLPVTPTLAAPLETEMTVVDTAATPKRRGRKPASEQAAASQPPVSTETAPAEPVPVTELSAAPAPQMTRPAGTEKINLF